jgi:phosphoenolpyruvate-protein kinase (PTS system EI component)
LAMDRLHPALAGRLDALHLAVLRLIRMTAQAAHGHAREAAVCGALASDPLAVPLLLGLGVRELSCVPAVIARIKALVRAVTMADCELLANAALKLDAATQVRELARDWQSQRGLFAEVA